MIMNSNEKEELEEYLKDEAEENLNCFNKFYPANSCYHCDTRKICVGLNTKLLDIRKDKETEEVK